MTYLLLLVGLTLLFVGGEFLVQGSVAVARRLGLSELLIGLTLVGFGTSTPELVTSLQAINQDAVGVALGNVVGSNIANILLIIGVAALIAPILTQPRQIARDLVVMVMASVALIALAWFDAFTRPVGIVLIIALLAYIVGSVILDRRGTPAAELHKHEGESVKAPRSLWVGLALAVGGLVGVVFGADLLVKNAVTIATAAGVSEAVIGLTLVAVGTSLPELATSVMAALRGKSDVAVGNIIGSNIFNVLGILGVTALVHPFSTLAGSRPADAGSADWSEVLSTQANGSILTFGDVSMVALSVFMLILFAATGRKIARWEGAVLLLTYIAYMVFLFGVTN